MQALIRPSPGGTPGQSRSMSPPQAWAIILASCGLVCATAADETISSAAPSASPTPFAIVASPQLLGRSQSVVRHLLTLPQAPADGPKIAAVCARPAGRCAEREPDSLRHPRLSPLPGCSQSVVPPAAPAPPTPGGAP